MMYLRKPTEAAIKTPVKKRKKLYMSELYLYGELKGCYNLPCIIIICRYKMGRGERTMRISYNKLFKLLVDKNMKKKELREKAGISASTIVKMGRNEPVSVELIGKICLALDCNAGDVVEFFPDEPASEDASQAE